MVLIETEGIRNVLNEFTGDLRHIGLMRIQIIQRREFVLALRKFP